MPTPRNAPPTRSTRKPAAPAKRRSSRRTPKAFERNPKVGDCVEIWWTVDKTFYRGRLTRRHPDDSFRVVYDDGEMEDLNLTTEYWRFAAPTPENSEQRGTRTQETEDKCPPNIEEEVLDGSDLPEKPNVQSEPTKAMKQKSRKKDKNKDSMASTGAMANTDASKSHGHSAGSHGRSGQGPQTTEEILEEGHAGKLISKAKEKIVKGDGANSAGQKLASTALTSQNTTSSKAPSKAKAQTKVRAAADKSAAKAKLVKRNSMSNPNAQALKGTRGATGPQSKTVVKDIEAPKSVKESVSGSTKAGRDEETGDMQKATPIKQRQGAKTSRKDADAGAAARGEGVHGRDRAHGPKPGTAMRSLNSGDRDDASLTANKANIQEKGRAPMPASSQEADASNPTSVGLVVNDSAVVGKKIPAITSGGIVPTGSKRKSSEVNLANAGSTAGGEDPEIEKETSKSTSPANRTRLGGSSPVKADGKPPPGDVIMKDPAPHASGPVPPAILGNSSALPPKKQGPNQEDSVRSKSSSEKVATSFAAKRKKKKRGAGVKVAAPAGQTAIRSVPTVSPMRMSEADRMTVAKPLGRKAAQKERGESDGQRGVVSSAYANGGSDSQGVQGKKRKRPESGHPARADNGTGEGTAAKRMREHPAATEDAVTRIDLSPVGQTDRLTLALQNDKQQMGTLLSPLQNTMSDMMAELRRLCGLIQGFKEEFDFYKGAAIDEGRATRTAIENMRMELMQAVDEKARQTQVHVEESVRTMMSNFEGMLGSRAGPLLQRANTGSGTAALQGNPRRDVDPAGQMARPPRPVRVSKDSVSVPPRSMPASVGAPSASQAPAANGRTIVPTAAPNVDHRLGDNNGSRSVADNEDMEVDGPMAEAAMRTRITHLVARQVTVWLLETPHEYNAAAMGSVAYWAKQTAVRTFAKVGEQLRRFSSYIQAYQTLCSSLGNDAVELQWFVSPGVSEHLHRARLNYAAWDPPPSDQEWEAEVVLLRELSARFRRALEGFMGVGTRSDMMACVEIANMAASDTSRTDGSGSGPSSRGKTKTASDVRANGRGTAGISNGAKPPSQRVDGTH